MLVLAVPPHKPYGPHWLVEDVPMRDAHAQRDAIVLHVCARSNFQVSYIAYTAVWSSLGIDWEASLRGQPLKMDSNHMVYTTTMHTWHSHAGGVPHTYYGHALVDDSIDIFAALQQPLAATVSNNINDYIQHTAHIDTGLRPDACLSSKTGNANKRRRTDSDGAFVAMQVRETRYAHQCMHTNIPF